MSHFGWYGPPDIVDTYSLLVLNISFRTTADDLFPYLDKYGKVVDIFIPNDRRTGESRGFAFVRYNYQDEVQKDVERLDGKTVDGREIMVQFAKHGPNSERMSRDDYYGDRDYYRRSRSRSYNRYDRDRYDRDRYDRDRYRERSRSYRYRSLSRSASPNYDRGHERGRYEDERRRSRSHSYGRKSLSPSQGVSPDRRCFNERSPTPQSVSPRRGPADSRSPRDNE